MAWKVRDCIKLLLLEWFILGFKLFNVQFIAPVLSLRSLQKSQDTLCFSISQLSAPRKVIITGAPGSGKGTLCKDLEKFLKVPHLSVGDLLRKEVHNHTAIGTLANSYIHLGQLVPESLLIPLVEHHITSALQQYKGWLLDGFPRNYAQACAFQKMGYTPDLLLILEVPLHLLEQRLLNRRLDPVTGQIYNLLHTPLPPPKILNRLLQRPDDRLDVLQTRFQTYEQNRQLLLQMFKCPLIHLDATQNPAQVLQQALKEMHLMPVQT